MVMQLTLEIPDHFLQGHNQNQTAQQIKLYAALLMFQSGQLSRGAACELAGVDIYDFFTACKIHHISVINTTEDEIEADVLRFQQRFH
jgi:predicted HTH domain antitoxin